VILICIGLAATFIVRLWAEQRESTELRTRLAEANAALQQEKNKSGQLNDQIAALTQQHATIPVFQLVITRGGAGAASPSVNSITLSQTQNWIILLLELPDVPGIVRYRAVVRDSRGMLVSDMSDLRSTSRDTLAVSFVSSLFMTGDYTLDLEGLNNSGM